MSADKKICKTCMEKISTLKDDLLFCQRICRQEQEGSKILREQIRSLHISKNKDMYENLKLEGQIGALQILFNGKAKEITELEYKLSCLGKTYLVSREEVLRLEGKVAALQDIIDEPLNK